MAGDFILSITTLMMTRLKNDQVTMELSKVNTHKNKINLIFIKNDFIVCVNIINKYDLKNNSNEKLFKN